MRLTVAIFLINKIGTPAVLSRILRKNYLISKTCETTGCFANLAKQPVLLQISRNNSIRNGWLDRRFPDLPVPTMLFVAGEKFDRDYVPVIIGVKYGTK